MTHVNQVLNRPLSSCSVLCSEASKSNHCEAAVNDLILLVLSVQGALSHSEGVEVAATCGASVFITSSVKDSIFALLVHHISTPPTRVARLLALKLLRNSEEGAVALGSGVLEIIEPLGLSPVEGDEHDDVQGVWSTLENNKVGGQRTKQTGRHPTKKGFA